MNSEVRLIPMHLIDEPLNAMRIEMDEGQLDELRNSMAAHGLDSPIQLVAREGRWRIAAGHRRFVCAKRLGWSEIRAFCRDASEQEEQRIKAQENLMRADVNDAELAVYMQQLIDEEGYDLDRLIALTGKSENWIAARLAMMRGDPEIFNLVRTGQLNMAQANELNKFPDTHRKMYVVQALQAGTSARVIDMWRRDLAVLLAVPQGDASTPAPTPAQQVQATVAPTTCCLCDSSQEAWDMIPVFVHKRELATIKQALAAGNVGGG